MTTGLVGQNQIAPFSSPIPGGSLDATVVLGNDNSTVTSYDAHDNDSTIHFQSSAVADRPPAGTVGRKWLTTDSGARYIYYDTGSAWVEVDYFRDTGGAIVGNVTVTGNVSISGTGAFSSYLTLGDTASGRLNLVTTSGSQGVVRYDSTGNTALYLENTYDFSSASIQFRVRTAGTPVVPLSMTSAGVAINNTVTAAVGVASTHKVTMVIGGVTYYLLASNV